MERDFVASVGWSPAAKVEQGVERSRSSPHSLEMAESGPWLAVGEVLKVAISTGRHEQGSDSKPPSALLLRSAGLGSVRSFPNSRLIGPLNCPVMCSIMLPIAALLTSRKRRRTSPVDPQYVRASEVRILPYYQVPSVSLRVDFEGGKKDRKEKRKGENDRNSIVQPKTRIVSPARRVGFPGLIRIP